MEALIDYHLPNACPDELLISRLIRHKRLSALTTTDYLEKLFGNRKARIHPYLTKNLITISQLTSESSNELLLNQTLASLFMYFLPQYMQIIRDGLFSNKSNQAIRACQFSSFKLKEPLALQFCPLCANDEVKSYGFSYWHVSHQLPGIKVCYLHGAILHYISVSDRHILDVLYLPLTNQKVIKADKLSIGLSKHATEIKFRISKGNEVICGERYKETLNSLGFVTARGAIRITKLSNLFYKFCLNLYAVPLDLIPSSEKDHRYLSVLLSNSNSQHPFKHFLFSYWLSKQKKNVI